MWMIEKELDISLFLGHVLPVSEMCDRRRGDDM